MEPLLALGLNRRLGGKGGESRVTAASIEQGAGRETRFCLRLQATAAHREKSMQEIFLGHHVIPFSRRLLRLPTWRFSGLQLIRRCRSGTTSKLENPFPFIGPHRKSKSDSKSPRAADGLAEGRANEVHPFERELEPCGGLKIPRSPDAS